MNSLRYQAARGTQLPASRTSRYTNLGLAKAEASSCVLVPVQRPRPYLTQPRLGLGWCLSGTARFPGRPTSTRDNRYVSESCLFACSRPQSPCPSLSPDGRCPVPTCLSICSSSFCPSAAVSPELQPLLALCPDTGCASSLHFLPIRKSKPFRRLTRYRKLGLAVVESHQTANRL